MERKKYQFTMFSKIHKPVATIVESSGRVEFAMKGESYQKALKKICLQRGWQFTDLEKYGYDTWKVRLADK